MVTTTATLDVKRPAHAEPALTVDQFTLSTEDLRLTNAYWRAANYLSVGQIYLYDNPLLREPLTAGPCEAARGRPLGYDAGAEFHLRPPEPRHQDRSISTCSISRGPDTVARRWSANTYLEGSYTDDLSRHQPVTRRG